MDCEKCIWGIINIFRERERDRQGRARKCGGSRKRRGRKAREDIRPVFIIALHCSLTISSPFSEREEVDEWEQTDVEKVVGRADVAAEFGRPCHRTWKTSITRQSLKRRLPYLPAVQKTRKSGSRRGSQRETAAQRGRPSRFHVKEGNSCGRICGAFPRDEADGSFFFIISLFVPPSLPLVLSLLLFFLDRE